MKQSKGEEACRVYFRNKFKCEFTRCRPDWLGGLELDGFNKDLALAFEYNGGQHYKYTPHFHKNNCGEFHNQVKRDVNKKKVCSERGIRLIVVPDLPVADIPGFLDVEFTSIKPKKGCIGKCIIV